MQKLDQLREPELKELQVRWQYDAYELEKKIARIEQKFQRAHFRYAALHAARKALETLRDQSAATLGVLEHAMAPAELLDAQRALIARYGQDLQQLPSHSARVSHRTDLEFFQMQLEELRHKLQLRQGMIERVEGLLHK